MENFEDILKLVTGNLSPEKKKKVIADIHDKKENKEIFKKVKISWAFLSSTRKLNDYEIENAYLKIQDKISGKKRKLNSTLKLVFKYAAIIVFLISLTTIYYTNKQQISHTAPQKKLSYTSFITENGQRSRVVLPDSSIVWLNSGTTLSYPSDFSEHRKVSLNGQAFFQVYHNEDSPFLVQANGLIVKVLGTKFDVDAYPENGEIAVVLESGKVELAHNNFESFNYTMQPGEQATYNITDNALTLNYVDAAIYSSWKDGKLIFRNESMKNVVEKLRRWYNINIEVTDAEVYNSIFSGTIQNESYEEIFRYIEIVCDVKCKLIHNYEEEAKPEIIISKK
ncbi:MAG: FecR domain-containing protein [Prolixibacteraceae bacterium]|jgi:ferric-dicitrate binding protein FerR (iron transport regulator)|nr:FecR domain-containing protein [Prolixibacteraceae bacterium]